MTGPSLRRRPGPSPAPGHGPGARGARRRARLLAALPALVLCAAAPPVEAAPRLDATPPSVDAAPATVDAGPTLVDAAATLVDAGSTRVDAARALEHAARARVDAPAPPGATAATPRGRADGPTTVPVATWTWPIDAPVAVVAPFEAPPAPWAAGHRGVDLSAGAGAVVRAPTAGTVTFAGAVAGRGVVTITTVEGLRSSVEPVRAAVAVGARVAPSDPLGTLEPAGGHCAPTACLHWGVRRGEVYLDPVGLVEGGPIVLLPVR